MESMDSNSRSYNLIKLVKIEETEDGINSLPKCQKNFEEVKIEESKDRISSLPDRILGHILSFLPTKYAVATCILSTRWKNIWTLLPNLDFDDELLLYTKRPTRILVRKMVSSFTSFINRVLILRNVSYLQRFRLKCGQSYESSHLNAWICAALWRNVQELDICISVKDSKVLPRGLFTCGTLISLKLGTKFLLNVPASVRFPGLKTLHLNSIEFLDDDSTQTLFSSCPVLEELLIEECGLKNINIFKIYASSLKRLTMECAFIGEYDTEFCEYEIIIDAPRLEYLKLIDYVAEGYSVKNLDSLLEAYIHVDMSSQQYEEGCYIYGQYVYELIIGISKVKVLHLFGDCMKALQLALYELPQLHNVTHLELGVNEDIGWQLLPDLLQSLPNLEALFLRGEPVLQNGRREFQWSPPEQVPHCLLFSLKRIKICAFRGLKEELKLVKYFLGNANFLHMLNIGTHLTKKEESKVSKKLLTFPRRSETCQVVLS